VSATVAVAGGLVASIAAPQAADAATGVASISGASTVDFATQAARAQVLAHPLKAAQAQEQLGTVAAQTQLAGAVPAKTYVVPKKVVRPAVSSVSRSTTRPAATTHTQRTQPAQPTQPTQPTNPAPPAPPTTTPAPPASSSGIVSIAERFIGAPYVYGGASPAGFDCSGFTSYVYGLAGKSLPRTATAQMNSVVRVSSPQPGDLIFFGSSSYAYHVAIYVGNGMMIDANHPGGTVGIRAIYSGVSGYGRL